METIEIIGASTAAVIAAGAWLKWATLPVVVAYRVGRGMGRLQAGLPARRAARLAAWVAAAR